MVAHFEAVFIWSLWWLQPDSLEVFTGYTMVELMPCLKDLHRIYFSAQARPQQAIQEKYKSSK